MKQLNIGINEHGYPFEINPDCEFSTLLHRRVAFKELFLPNQGRIFKRSFSDYVVHHIDGNKLNYHRDNLMILTEREHYWFHNSNVTTVIKNLGNTRRVIHKWQEEIWDEELGRGLTNCGTYIDHEL